MIFEKLFVQNRILETALQAYALRDNVIQNNISNVNTPDFKRSDVVFESYLADALAESKKTGVLSLNKVKAKVVTPKSGFSIHSGGNNVDIDSENVILYTNSVKYDTVVNSITSKYKAVSLVLNAK